LYTNENKIQGKKPQKIKISNLQQFKGFLRQMKQAITLLIPGGTLPLGRKSNKLFFNTVNDIHSHIPIADRTTLFF